MYLEEAPSSLGIVELLCPTGPRFLSLKYKANIIDQSTGTAKNIIENQDWIHWLHAYTQNGRQNKQTTTTTKNKYMPPGLVLTEK